jgi:gliding motility-associated-like protein
MVNDKGCEYTDSVFIKVLPKLISDFYVNKRYNCEDTPELEFVNQSINARTFLWEFGDGTTSEEESPVYQYSVSDQDIMTIPDTFTVRLKAVNSFCQEVKEQKITSIKPFVPNIISPNDDNKNDHFQIMSDQPVNLKIYNRWGKLVYENNSYDNSWKGDDVSNGVYYYVIRLPDNETDCIGWIHVLR